MDPIDFPIYIHRSGAAHFREISNQVKSFATPRRRKTIRDPKDPQRHSDDVPTSEEEMLVPTKTRGKPIEISQLIDP